MAAGQVRVESFAGVGRWMNCWTEGKRVERFSAEEGGVGEMKSGGGGPPSCHSDSWETGYQLMLEGEVSEAGNNVGMREDRAEVETMV